MDEKKKSNTPAIYDDFDLEVYDDNNFAGEDFGSPMVEGSESQPQPEVRPYGYNPFEPPVTPMRTPSMADTVKTDKNMPVYVVNTIVTEHGQAVDMEDQFYDAQGYPVQLIFDNKYMLQARGPLYKADRTVVYPKLALYPFMPDEVYNQRGDKMKLMLEPADQMEKVGQSYALVDEKGRPIYPLGTMNTPEKRGGYITDRDQRPIYPTLMSGSKFYTQPTQGRQKMEIQPTTMTMFDKLGRPVYPYGTEDNRVFDDFAQTHERVASVPNMAYMPQENGMYPSGPSNMEQPNQQNQNPYNQPNHPSQQNDYGYNMEADNQGRASKRGLFDEEDDGNPPTTNKPWYKDPKWIGMIVGIFVLIGLLIFGYFKFFSGPTDTFELDNTDVTVELDKNMKLNLEDFFGKNMSDKALEEVEIECPKLNINKTNDRYTTQGKDTVIPDTYNLTFKYKKDELKATLTVQDTTQPEISGGENVNFAVGQYSDEALIKKFDIKDASEVKVTVDTAGQNLSREGKYSVEITAVDSSNNKTTKSVNVTVAKTAKQKEEEESKKAEEERQAKEEAERRAEEEARRKAEEEAKINACVPSLPKNAYTSEAEALIDSKMMETGMKETTFPVKEGQRIIVKKYQSNCGTDYWLIEAE